MDLLTGRIALLAQEAPPADPAATDTWALFVPFLLIVILWYFMISRPQSRQRAEHQTMLDKLKKNDNVVTIGGILGTVANISSDGREITLKVDDNSRLRVQREAIRDVIVKSEHSESSTKSA